MSTVVHVQNIAAQTGEKEVRDFFSFCGKITNLSITPASGEAGSTQSATVTFEKETAAKTALLLDNTQLGASQVHVTPGPDLGQVAAAAGSQAAGSEDEIAPEDKPRTRILAEYLAHGYVLSDQAIQKAIALDNQHGLSNRFTSALQTWDQKLGATERAKGIDSQYGLTGHAQTGFNTLHSYFEKAIGTPTGQKLASLYTQGEKQVRDVHAEARRLADLRAGKQNVPQPVAGSDKTTCQCGGDDGGCPCAEGKCACTGCSKSTQTPAQAAAAESAQAAVDGQSVPAPTAATEGAPQTTGNS